MKSKFTELLLKAIAMTASFFALLDTCLSRGPELGEKIAQIWGYPENIGYLCGVFSSLFVFVVVVVTILCVLLTTNKQENNLTYSEVAQ